MFNEFDEFISGFFTEDYWYNEGVFIAQELLEKFEEEDYEKLKKNFLSKSDKWEKRFVYCIDNNVGDNLKVSYNYYIYTIMMNFMSYVWIR